MEKRSIVAVSRNHTDKLLTTSNADKLIAFISDAQRNVILQHASSRVYERNYLPRYITQDTQAVYRGLEPQVALTRFASGMSRTIDTRQPRRLNRYQLAEVDQHPEVQLLLRTRNGMKKRLRATFGSVARAQGTSSHKAYRNICKEYERVRKFHCRASMKAVQAGYRKQRALLDIATQLDPEEKTPEDQGTGLGQATRPLSAERHAVLDALFSQPSADPIAERERRSVSIKAITTLSKRQEPRPPGSRRRQRPAMLCKDGTELSPPPSTTFPLKCAATQCIFCLGNIDLTQDLRVRTFRDSYSLQSHFKRMHLNRLPDGKAIVCPHPMCHMVLKHKQHLQRHAFEAHNTRT